MSIQFGLNDRSSFYDVAEYFEGVQARFESSWGRPMPRPDGACPKVAKYIGTGDKTKASSFRCREPDVSRGSARMDLPMAEGHGVD